MLEQWGLTCAVTPIGGGWRFPQQMPDGSILRVPLKGSAGSDAELVKQVEQLRINSGIDLNDVAAEVAEYIRSASPPNNRFPKRKSPNGAILPKPKHRPYIERIKDWLITIGRTTPRLLIEDEADARAEVCIQCAQNVKWKTGCLGCCESVTHRGQHVRQRPSYKHDARLGACRLHDLHLGTAVFIDREALPPLNENAPNECWMRTI